MDKGGVNMKIEKKQLAALFMCSLVPWLVGNGLLPLLPVYAEQLGADSLVAGLYLAVVYLMIAMGALSAGWVSESRLGRKIPIIFAYLLASPLAWALGRVTTLWALIVLTALLWLLAGMGLALIMILTGLSAGKDERGKVFGVLALTSGLGAVIGGLGTGWLVRGWGYPTMFTVLGIILLFGPLSGLFLDEKHVEVAGNDRQEAVPPAPLGRAYFSLFTASILAAIGGFMIVLIRSLVMNRLGFDALEISSTVVVGGVITLPLPFLLGWLSDRVNRKWVLILGYLQAFIALSMLAFSHQLWHFWLVSAFAGIAVGSNSSVGNALVTDLVLPEALGKGLALFSATTWIGGIIGFALAGLLLKTLPVHVSCYLGSILVAAAIGLLLLIHTRHKVSQPQTGDAR